MRIGFEFDVLEAVISPENEYAAVIRELFEIMQEQGHTAVLTEHVLSQIERMAKYQKEELTKIFETYRFERIEMTDKSDSLAEDYLMYGLIHRKNKKNAQNIAAYAQNGIPFYVTLNYSYLGKHLNREKLNELNRKRKVVPIDLGSPLHTRQFLSKPDLVQAVHKAQEEVFHDKRDISLEEEIVKTRRKARHLIWKKKSKSGQ